MNTQSAIAAALALAFASCQKPVVVEPPQPPPASTPAPAPPVALVPAATPVARQLAPEGRYFLRRKISVETADGITAYAPGTALTQTGEGEYRTDKGETLKVPATDVTNDLAEARALVAGDANARAALARMTAVAPAKAPSAFPSTPSPVARTVPAQLPKQPVNALDRKAFGETGSGRDFDYRRR